jgi:Tfp pilus assembly protein PilF
MDRIAQLKAFLEKTPDDSFVQHALALEYIKRNDDAAAKGLFETLLRANEDYIGSYYHLAKLLERNGEREQAVAVYEKGLAKSKALGDNHTYNELLAAYEDFTDI